MYTVDVLFLISFLEYNLLEGISHVLCIFVFPIKAFHHSCQNWPFREWQMSVPQRLYEAGGWADLSSERMSRVMEKLVSGSLG
jgi:hypothetical protein